MPESGSGPGVGVSEVPSASGINLQPASNVRNTESNSNIEMNVMMVFFIANSFLYLHVEIRGLQYHYSIMLHANQYDFEKTQKTGHVIAKIE